MVDIVYAAGGGNLTTAIGPGSSQHMFTAQKVLVKDFRMARIKGTLVWLDSDSPTDPVLIPYIADGDLTAAEIDEVLETPILDPSDVVAMERSKKRRVFPLEDADGTPIQMSARKGEVGFSMKVNQTWKEGKGWVIGFYNLSEATTVVTTDWFGILYKAFGVWIA